MLLSWKEMKHSKGKYIMIFVIITLIAYLVFFLTGLAYGLAEAGRLAADKWEASAVIMTKEADNNLSISSFNKEKLSDVTAKEKAPLAQSASVISSKGKGKENVTLFGVNKISFIAPNIIKGHQVSKNNELVIDESLAKVNHYHIGDEVTFAGDSKKYKIVGLTNRAKFNVAPVVYMTIPGLNELRFGHSERNDMINAIVVRGKAKVESDLEVIPIKTFINGLPGYSAQVMTFSFMIIALIIIAAVVLGIFIFVLTMHKQKTIGIMKIQGVPTRMIATSSLMQTLILAVSGVILGVVLTFLSSLGLPKSMPFEFNVMLTLGVGVLMIVITNLASLVSIRSIVKIDPLKAMNMGDE